MVARRESKQPNAFVPAKGKGWALRPNGPGERRGGRQAGKPNRLGGNVREGIFAGFVNAGERLMRDRKSEFYDPKWENKSDVIYLATYIEWAALNVKTAGAALALLGKLLPWIVVAKVGETHEHVIKTSEELLKELQTRGLPLQSLFGAMPQLEDLTSKKGKPITIEHEEGEDDD